VVFFYGRVYLEGFVKLPILLPWRPDLVRPSGWLG